MTVLAPLPIYDNTGLALNDTGGNTGGLPAMFVGDWAALRITAGSLSSSFRFFVDWYLNATDMVDRLGTGALITETFDVAGGSDTGLTTKAAYGVYYLPVKAPWCSIRQTGPGSVPAIISGGRLRVDVTNQPPMAGTSMFAPPANFPGAPNQGAAGSGILLGVSNFQIGANVSFFLPPYAGRVHLCAETNGGVAATAWQFWAFDYKRGQQALIANPKTDNALTELHRDLILPRSLIQVVVIPGANPTQLFATLIAEQEAP